MTNRRQARRTAGVGWRDYLNEVKGLVEQIRPGFLMEYDLGEVPYKSVRVLLPPNADLSTVKARLPAPGGC